MNKQSRFLQTLLMALLPAVAAVALTYLLSLVLQAPQLKGGYLFNLIADRGPVQWATMGLAFWTASALALKFIMVNFDKRGWNHLPFAEGEARIKPGDAPLFLGKISDGPKVFRNSLLGRRLVMGLENFRAHGKVQEVMDAVNTQSDVDARESENSYTIVKIFVASIPILGFIGTVIGIGSAVGGFGATLDGMEEVKEIQSSLKTVTSGLSVAFDTTLLALVMSIILMLPLGLVQQYEERGLNRIDDFVNNEFINLLMEEPVTAAAREAAATGGAVALAKGPAVDDGLTPEERRLQGAQFSGEMEALMTQVRAVHREQVETMQATGAAISEHSARMQEVFAANTQFMQSWGAQFTENLQTSQGAMAQSQEQLADRLETGRTSLEEVAAKQESATADYLKALAASSEQLNQSTEQWKSRESELLGHFDQRARENMDTVTAAFESLLAKQTAMVESAQAIQRETARQTEVYQELVPALTRAAETQLADSRQKLEADSEAFSGQLLAGMQRVFEQVEERSAKQAELVDAMQEQSRQQAEVLREFHERQKNEHSSLEHLTGQWNDIAKRLEQNGGGGNGGDRKKGWFNWGE